MNKPRQAELLIHSKLFIGLINNNEIELGGPGKDQWLVHSFRFSPDSVGFSELPDTAFATPARYLQEIHFRLSRLDTASQQFGVFILNPLLETNRFNLLIILNHLGQLRSERGCALVSDSGNFPLGYLLPLGREAGDADYLTLLSAFNANLDEALLAQIFLEQVDRVVVPNLKMNQITHNGFYHDVEGPLCWVAARAIETLRHLQQGIEAPRTPTDIRKLRDAMPFTAFMPHHAGDVLFFCLAFNITDTRITRLAVNKSYSAIVADTSPRLAILGIQSEAINRSNQFRQGQATKETEYFDGICEQLPSGSFYYYCRPSRNYNLSDFHLIDHFAFAIGRHCCDASQLLINAKTAPAWHQPTGPDSPIRVLLHFAGGWPLKIYPGPMQEELIDRLYAHGYDITVLADEEWVHQKCQFVTFQGYEEFKALLESQHLLIGMDSFPCHYAAHILGTPTLCLFASTKPANSNARHTAIYKDLERGLTCRPCYAINTCPIDGSTACKNFVSPDVVLTEAENMLKRLASEMVIESALKDDANLRDDCLESTVRRSTRTLRINTSRSAVKIRLAVLLLPLYRYTATLYSEFTRAIRREGLASAVWRSVRFIYRRLSR